VARHRILAGALIAALVSTTVLAQIGTFPVVNPPNFSVSLHAAGLQASGKSMASDRFGNVYVLDQPNVTATGSITKVDFLGVATPQFVGGLGALSQIAYDPVDGYCYVAAWAPILPVVISTIWRIDPGQGAVAAGSVNLIPSGFTIDDAGMMYFGTQTALQGAGLYRHDPNGPSGNATFVSPGFADNAILQSVVSGDVLIGSGNQVQRWAPTHPGPLPNSFASVNSLARTPFNQNGAGALIGLSEFVTVCFCGQGLTVSAGLTGQNPQIFATEPYSSPFNGLRCIASGLFRDEWWYTEQPSPLAGKLLWRIQQDPAHGSQGSLMRDIVASDVTLHIYGPVAGGDPFLFGAVSDLVPVSLAQFVPPFGIIDLYPFDPFYTPVFDGIGVFGPPNPFAQIPAGGHFQLTVNIPPSLSGLGFHLQALIVSPNFAPNGLFFISNGNLLVLP
jgi:hypothetical protein